MRVFLDTSAFVKRYVSEAGTDTVLEWCDQATEIILSGMDAIHIGSAIALKADVFLSADKRQLDAAASMGLRVVAV